MCKTHKQFIQAKKKNKKKPLDLKMNKGHEEGVGR